MLNRNKKSKSILRNERGIALLETIPLLVVFIILLAYGLGLYGAIHTGILHSIAARTYALETFRNRANLNYYREDGTGMTTPLHLAKKGWRFHAVQPESAPPNQFFATGRPITMDRSVASASSSETVHNEKVFNMKERNQEISVSPIWVMVGYGLCLTAQCGQ